MAETRGKVFLVGAGPGAPELITLRGAEVLGDAQVVIYDSLVNEELLGLCRNAELIVDRKSDGLERAGQDAINHQMIEHARAGKLVVRLKGGDPFIFGRGGEEADALAAAGIDFEIVPGVTSAIAAPAYAGIALTHRDRSSFVAFITGHEDEAKHPGPTVPWDELARAAKSGGTLVLLMALRRLKSNLDRLKAAGLPGETPAAAIQQASTASQRTVISTLANLAAEVQKAKLTSPVIFVIGETARLSDRLRWFESRPLFGRRMVVTRARGRSGALTRPLRDFGAEVIECPTIETVDPDSYAPLDGAIGELRSFDWMIFTSAQGVESFMARMRTLERDVRDLHGISIAAIGPATAARLQHFGLRVDVIPQEFRAESILEAIGAERVRGKSFLIPRAQVARQALIDLLRSNGVLRVEAPACYKTVRPDGQAAEHVRSLLDAGQVDLVVFTSSSTVTNFVDLIGNSPKHQAAAAIGPITAQTAREAGFDVVIQPEAYTVPSLAAAIRGYFEKSTSSERSSDRRRSAASQPQPDRRTR